MSRARARRIEWRRPRHVCRLSPGSRQRYNDRVRLLALSSFLATSLIASRLSAKAKTRASEAVERQRDLEQTAQHYLSTVGLSCPVPAQFADGQIHNQRFRIPKASPGFGLERSSEENTSLTLADRR